MSAVCLALMLFTFPAQTSSGPIEDFCLSDARGQEHRLSDWSDRKLIVVTFLSVDCPLAKLYGPRLADLAEKFASRSVAFIGIHTNQAESLAALSRYARDHHITFPILRDLGNAVADRFDARRTPEVFILDERRAIRYRGRIDDQFDLGLQRAKESRRDLEEALEELLAGKAVSRPVTDAVGCLITRTKPAPEGKVTYTKEIAPILRKRCQACHRPGQIAPFALTSYKAAAGWSAMIREVVEQGRMPPWHANPKFGRFANDPSLGASEKKLLVDWIDAGCPEGDAADLPPPGVLAEKWNIRPDLVLSMPRPFTVAAEGVIEYQFFEVDPRFTEDHWVQAAEIRPGNRAVVHHCNVFLQPPGVQGPAEQGRLGSHSLAEFAAGTPPTAFPPGMAKRIPAGWRLIFVLHYSAIGSVQTDQTSIALQFADPATVRQEVATKLMYDTDLCIPPHAANHTVSQTWLIHEDVLLLSMFPHMHVRGKSFRYEALYPNGETEVLLDVPRYDFNWQHIYFLAEPLRLRAGTRLRCTAVYDNSAANSANPDPYATVRAGTQSWEEMFNGYFDIVLADEDLSRPTPWGAEPWRTVQSMFRPGMSLIMVLCGCAFLAYRRLQIWSGCTFRQRHNV